MITIKLDCTKIDKNRMIAGKPKKDGSIPKYIDLVLFENKNGPDEWGNDGFVAQSVSKEEREKGVRGPILGNWKELSKGQGSRRQQASEPAAAVTSDHDSVPF